MNHKILRVGALVAAAAFLCYGEAMAKMAPIQVQRCERAAGPDRISLSKIDPEKALKICLQAYESHPDNIDVWAYLGRVYLAARNNRDSLTWYRKAAEKGHPYSQYNLAMMYSNGVGVVKNPREANRWYHAAADNGEMHAQTDLGHAYQFGKGVEKDEAEAAKWYRKAAMQGFPQAKHLVGSLMFFGDEKVRNRSEGIQWLISAAVEGVAESQLLLGSLSLAGNGVPQSDEEAARWFKYAADQNLPEAQYSLALLYSSGVGVKKDLSAALDYAEKSAAGGYAKADTLVKKLKFEIKARKNPSEKATPEDVDALLSILKKEKAETEAERDELLAQKKRLEEKKKSLEARKAEILARKKAAAEEVARLQAEKKRLEAAIRARSGPGSEDIRAWVENYAATLGMAVQSFSLDKCYPSKSGEHFCHFRVQYSGRNPLSAMLSKAANAFDGAVWAGFRKGSGGWYHVKTYTDCDVSRTSIHCEFRK